MKTSAFVAERGGGGCFSTMFIQILVNVLYSPMQLQYRKLHSESVSSAWILRIKSFANAS